MVRDREFVETKLSNKGLLLSIHNKLKMIGLPTRERQNCWHFFKLWSINHVVTAQRESPAKHSVFNMGRSIRSVLRKTLVQICPDVFHCFADSSDQQFQSVASILVDTLNRQSSSAAITQLDLLWRSQVGLSSFRGSAYSSNARIQWQFWSNENWLCLTSRSHCFWRVSVEEMAEGGYY